MKYFLDTYALIEIANENKKYQKIIDEEAVTLRDNLAELFYFFLKTNNEKTALYLFKRFSTLITSLPLSYIPKAMVFRQKNKKKHFSYIDCLGYTYAQEEDLIFVTGDRAFEDMKNTQIIR